MKNTVITVAAIGTRGVSLFRANRSKDGKTVSPTHDHDGNVGSFDSVPLGAGQLIPWTKSPTGKAVHAWVSRVNEPVTLMPLDEAIRLKRVKEAECQGKRCYVPADYQKGQKLPQYVGTEHNLPLGRLEGKKVKNGDGSVRNLPVLRGRERAATSSPTKPAAKAATSPASPPKVTTPTAAKKGLKTVKPVLLRRKTK